MQVPMSWLRTLVNCQLSTSELAEVLTTGGIEVEEIHGFGAYDPRVVLGDVKEVTVINKAQGIYLLSVDVGELIPIVTKQPGDHALKLGARLAVARSGASLISKQNECLKLQTIHAGKLYDCDSEGMLCSALSLGIGDETSCVYKVTSSKKPGTAIRDVLQPNKDWLADEVLVIAILANIARCQSMIGMAREVAALTGAALTLEQMRSRSLETVANTLTPLIDDTSLCRRFSLAKFSGIQVMPSPLWIQQRLLAAGVTPINNVVDASNYVMIEMGQPTHAYDEKKLQQDALTVRSARQNEAIHVLTQTEDQAAQALQVGQAVIVDQNKVVAIAGIVGGTETAIDDDTTAVLLESANFDYISIRRTQADLKIYTDGSSRFSRGVDPRLTLPSIERFASILKETCQACDIVAYGDNVPDAFVVHDIELTAKQVNVSLGMNFTIAQIAKLLQRVDIACRVDSQAQSLVASVDVDREDISGTHDLIEEVARLYGYDNLPETMPLQPIPLHPTNTIYLRREQARDAMVLWGMQEVMSYAFSSVALEAQLLVTEQAQADIEQDNYVSMKNPNSEERDVLRRSLLPSLLQYAANHLKHETATMIFEIGPVFYADIAGKDIRLPAEEERLTAIIVGKQTDLPLYQGAMPARDFDFYDAASVVEFLFKHLHIDEVCLQAASQDPFHPGQCARITRRNKDYGVLGVLHPTIAERFHLEKYTPICVDLNLSEILKDCQQDYLVYAPFKYPSIQLDISIVIDEAICAHWVLSLMQSTADNWWVSGEIFDVYRSDSLGTGKKALAIRFTLNARTRTLTMQEANHMRETIVAKLHEQIGAKLRHE